MDAVEACQSIKGRNPEISVRCLSNTANLVLRHAIVYGPNLNAVLGKRRLDQAEENCQVGEKTYYAAGIFQPKLTPNAAIGYMLPAWLRHQLPLSFLTAPIAARP